MTGDDVFPVVHSVRMQMMDDPEVREALRRARELRDAMEPAMREMEREHDRRLHNLLLYGDEDGPS